MTDIIDRLKEPEEHYPGNFDTPKRANAMLSCLCQEAMEEIESLRRELKHMTDEYPAALEAEQVRYRQLAASQAREQQLREALNHHHEIGLGRGRDKSHSLSQLIISGYKHGPLCRITDEALALPADTTALEAMIAKAGEVMRERCVTKAMELANCEDNALHYRWAAEHCAERTRALPAVTLDDLKGGA